MDRHWDRITLVVLVIITLWGTYMFGYNKGFSEAMTKTEIRQNKTLNALQLANQYQAKYTKCIELKAGN